MFVPPAISVTALDMQPGEIMTSTPPANSAPPTATAPPKPARPRTPPPRRPFLALVVLLALFGAIFCQLYRTRLEPLERDQPTYAAIAHEMLGGRKLYSDIFDQKPPAIYATYAQAERAFGYNRHTIFMLALITAALLLWGMFVTGNALSRERRGGLWTAALFALVGLDIVLEANQPNTEVFINVCALWGFALFVRDGEKLMAGWKAILAGLLFALATMYKPNLIVVPVLLMAAYIAYPPVGKPNRKHAVALGVLFFATLGLSWLGVSAYFVVTGRGDAFAYAMITYNRAYSGNPLQNLIALLQPDHLLPPFARSLVFLPAIVLVGIIVGWFTPERRQWLLLLAYLMSSLIAVGLPGMYYPHYYQLLLPPLIVGAGWTISLLTLDAKTVKVAAGFALALFAFGMGVFREAKTWKLSPIEVSRLKYQEEFVSADVVGKRINALLLPNEIFYDASTSPELYFISKRPIQCGVFYSYATVHGPRAEQFSDRVLAWLDHRPPELISLRAGDDLNPRIQKWIAQRYIPLPPNQQLKPFTLLMRRGGILSRRLPPEPTPTPPPIPNPKSATKATPKMLKKHKP